MLNLLFGAKKGRRGRRTRRGSVKPFTIKTIEAEWRTINTLLEGKKPSQLRQALISADKTLDTALRDVVRGDTMGERLKNSFQLFDRDLYNRIWSAHKTRNALVHESGYEPPSHVMIKNVDIFKKALNSLGMNNL